MELLHFAPATASMRFFNILNTLEGQIILDIGDSSGYKAPVSRLLLRRAARRVLPKTTAASQPLSLNSSDAAFPKEVSNYAD
jgi:hypothetical protein